MNADPEIVPTNTKPDLILFVSCPITGIIILNPLYHSIVEDNKTKAKYTIVPIGTSNNMIVRVFPEKSSTYRGIHITIILDKSGSMGTKVSNTDPEMGDVTQFAVAKYAAMFIVNSLVKDGDRLTLITFDENYYVSIDYMLMNADTRKQSSDIINEIKLGNSTNFTNPIKYTINNIIRKNNSGSNTVVLLTDGIPDNPKTAVNEIKTFISGLIMPKHINFYLIGIGCNINSDILLGIANILGGNYNFIFDYTTVGTTFVNMLSNIRCITTSHAKLTLVFETDVDVKNQEFDLGQLFGNQLKCCVIELGTHIPTQVKVEYFEDSCNEHETIIAQFVEPEHNIITCCLARAFVIRGLNNVINNLSDLPQAKHNMSNICEYITDIVSNNKELNSTTKEYLDALLHDIRGECILALDKTKVNVWGKHHLIAFMNAHNNMECTTYKSKSLQYYTSADFENERETHDEIFNNLTVPVPVREPSRNSSQLTAVQAASRLNNPYIGCIHSHTLIKMLDGTKIKASDIKPGDKVSTGTVIYIMETIIPKRKVFMCTLPGLEGLEGLRITPNHPVCSDSDSDKKWVYPKDIIEPTDIKCDAYYSFVVMEDGNYKSYIEACGYQVLTLAHGIIGSIAEHSYLGSQRIIDDFMRSKAYLNNHYKMTFIEPCFTRDPNTGWVNGLDFGKEKFPQK